MKTGNINEIERDLEETRARTERTIEALQNKLQPRAVLDEATRFFQGTDSGAYAEDVTRKAIAQARENPLPLLLIGAGTALLASKRPGRPVYMNHETGYDADASYGATMGAYEAEEYRESQELTALYDAEWEDSHRIIGSNEALESSFVRNQGEDDTAYNARLYDARGKAFAIERDKNEDDASFRKRIDEKLNAAKAKASEVKAKAATFKDRQAARAKQFGSDTRDRASAAYGSTRQGISSAYGSTRDGARSAYDGTRRGASSALSSTKQAARSGAQKTVSFHESNPLVSAGLAVAAGAAAAAFFRTTEPERRALGPVGDELNDAAKRLNETANQKVAQYAEKVKDVAEDADAKVDEVAKEANASSRTEAGRT